MNLSFNFVVINFPRSERFEPHEEEPERFYNVWVNGGFYIQIGHSVVAATDYITLVQFALEVLIWIEKVSTGQACAFRFKSYDSGSDKPEIWFDELNGKWSIGSIWQKGDEIPSCELDDILSALKVYLTKIDTFLKHEPLLAKNVSLKQLRDLCLAPVLLPTDELLNCPQTLDSSNSPTVPEVLVSLALMPGLYANINTNLGPLTIKLYESYVPKAVAHFVGLAQGSLAWYDQTASEWVNRPFYEGLTFHYVGPGYLIMGGSPTGDNSGGPGISFEDEFHAELRHDRAGVVSFSNRENPDAKGSQFVITDNKAPWLDDWNTIFGQVIEGLPVVQAISQVKSDGFHKPLVPVLIEGIEIFRIQS